MSFDFDDFATLIYREHPEHAKRFMLPALYGGAMSCDWLVVLEGPSIRFTERLWTPCSTPQEAIQQHRAIFYEWAGSGRQFYLFQRLAPKASYEDFFARLYITDIWKDGHVGKNQKQAGYWSNKLALELTGVPAKRILFVGDQAGTARSHAPGGVPVYTIRFPYWSLTNDEVAADADHLMAEVEECER
jgi:hypothetical protein